MSIELLAKLLESGGGIVVGAIGMYYMHDILKGQQEIQKNELKELKTDLNNKLDQQADALLIISKRLDLHIKEHNQ